MDKIQKILVEAGRKDLAQLYFNKIAQKSQKQKDMEKDFKKVEELDRGKDGYHTIRKIYVRDESIFINCHAGTPVTNYLKGLIKKTGLDKKYDIDLIPYKYNLGDVHEYEFEYGKNNKSKSTPLNEKFLKDLVDEVVDDIEHWIGIESDKFLKMKQYEKYALIEKRAHNSIIEFASNEEEEKFIEKNMKKIILMIISKIK